MSLRNFVATAIRKSNSNIEQAYFEGTNVYLIRLLLAQSTTEIVDNELCEPCITLWVAAASQRLS